MMRPKQHLIDPNQPSAVFEKAGSAPQGAESQVAAIRPSINSSHYLKAAICSGFSKQMVSYIAGLKNT